MKTLELDNTTLTIDPENISAPKFRDAESTWCTRELEIGWKHGGWGSSASGDVVLSIGYYADGTKDDHAEWNEENEGARVLHALMGHECDLDTRGEFVRCEMGALCQCIGEFVTDACLAADGATDNE